MAKKQSSDVDVWLGRETPRVRKALESASRYFDGGDRLTVNTLEAVYGQESSFGTRLRALTLAMPRPRRRGISKILTACSARTRSSHKGPPRCP